MNVWSSYKADTIFFCQNRWFNLTFYSVLIFAPSFCCSYFKAEELSFLSPSLYVWKLDAAVSLTLAGERPFPHRNSLCWGICQNVSSSAGMVGLRSQL